MNLDLVWLQGWVIFLAQEVLKCVLYVGSFWVVSMAIYIACVSYLESKEEHPQKCYYPSWFCDVESDDWDADFSETDVWVHLTAHGAWELKVDVSHDRNSKRPPPVDLDDHDRFYLFESPRACIQKLMELRERRYYVPQGTIEELQVDQASIDQKEAFERQEAKVALSEFMKGARA